MKIEEFENYGEDIISIQEHSKMPFRKKLAIIIPVLSYVWSAVRALGISRIIGLVREFRCEIQKSENYDWTNLSDKGISDEHLKGIIKKIVVAKVMVTMLGMDKATQLRKELSGKISILPQFASLSWLP